MRLRRAQLLLMLVLFVFIGLYFLLDLGKHLNYDTLLQSLGSLKESLRSQTLIFIFLFFLLYLLVTASSIPIATALTVAGGALMGNVVAPLVIVPAATIGCIIPYFAAKLLLKDYIQRRFKKALVRVNKGIEDSGWWFLLSARLNPILPYVVLNLVSGVSNLPLKQYALATFIGIIPGTVVSTYAGSQITASIEAGTVMRPGVFVALLLLAALPLVIRYVQKRFLRHRRVSRV